MNDNGWIWMLVFIVVAVVIFMLVYNAAKVDTRRLGPVSREDFNIVAGRVNLLWALLIFWILMNFLYLLYIIFTGKPTVASPW